MKAQTNVVVTRLYKDNEQDVRPLTQTIEIGDYITSLRGTINPWYHITSADFDLLGKYLLCANLRAEPHSYAIYTVRAYAGQNHAMLFHQRREPTDRPLSLHATYEEARRAMIAAKPPRRDRIKPAPPTHGTPPPTPLPSTEPKTKPEPEQ